MRRFVFGSGLRLIVEKKEGSIAAIGLSVGVGAAQEERDHAGISHLLEHVVCASLRRKVPDQMAVEIRGWTDYCCTTYTVLARRDSLQKAVELTLRILDAPNGTDLQKEVSVVEKEIDWRLQRSPWVHHLLSLPLGRCSLPVEGLSPRPLDEKDLQRHHQRYYQPVNMAMAVVGEVDPLQVAAWVLNHGPKQEAALPLRYLYSLCHHVSLPLEADLRVRPCESQRGWFSISYPVPGWTDPRRAGMELVPELINHLVDRGLYPSVESIRAHLLDLSWDVSLLIFLVTPSCRRVFKGEDLIELADKVARGLEAIGKQALPEEVRRSARSTAIRWMMKQEDEEMRAATLSRCELLGEWNLVDRLTEHLYWISPEEFSEVASSCLIPEKRMVVVHLPTDLYRRIQKAKHAILLKEKKAQGDLSSSGSVPNKSASCTLLKRFSTHSVVVARRATPLLVVGFLREGGINRDRRHGGATALLVRSLQQELQRKLAPNNELTVSGFYSIDVFGFTLEGPQRAVRSLIRPFLIHLQSPSWSPEILAWARRQVSREYQNGLRVPHLFCRQLLESLLLGSRSLNPLEIGGLIDKVSMADLERRWEESDAHRWVLSSAGNLSLEDLLASMPESSLRAKETKGQLTLADLSPLRVAPVLVRCSQEKVLFLCVGFPVPGLLHTDYLPLLLLSEVLSHRERGRLVQKLRRRQA